MKQIGTLYIYELKKIISRKIVWIVGAIMVMLCVFLSFSDLILSSYYGEEEISGYEAMQIYRQYARSLEGRAIDDTLLREMQDSYSKETVQKSTANDSIVIKDEHTTITTNGLQNDETDKGITDYTPIYSYVQEITGDNNLTSEIDSDGLYKEREKTISQNRTDQILTEKEKAYWEGKDKQTKIPFTYGYTDGWSNLWQYVYTINYMILLMLAICLSQIFLSEHSRKTDAIILCSKYGKGHLYLAKILAGITFGGIVSMLFFGVTAISSVCVYGADGFSTALQLAFPLSSWNTSIGESVLILLFVLLVVSVLYSITIMVLSEILKNSVAVMSIPVGIMLLTMMIDIPYEFRIASQVYDLLPTNLLTTWGLWDDRLFSVFGKYLINFQIAPIIYLIISIILFFVGKKAYLKYQIGAR